MSRSALDPLREEVRLRLDLKARLDARKAARLARYRPAGQRAAETARHKLARDPLVMEQIVF